jgi:hypothetical protein
MNPLRWSWILREPPLPAAAVTARPQALNGLLAATARRVRAGHELRVAVGAAGGVVLGAEKELPWFPGAVYLGWEAGILVPTTRMPSLPVDFLAATLRRRLPDRHGLVVLVPWAVLAAPMPGAPADPAALQAHLDAVDGNPGPSTAGGGSDRAGAVGR